MAGGQRHRTGILVLRVWHEKGSAGDGFRARILSRADPDDPEQVTEVVASPEEVLATVSSWLEAVRAASG
jgi:hypothetical protein